MWVWLAVCLHAHLAHYHSYLHAPFFLPFFCFSSSSSSDLIFLLITHQRDSDKLWRRGNGGGCEEANRSSNRAASSSSVEGSERAAIDLCNMRIFVLLSLFLESALYSIVYSEKLLRVFSSTVGRCDLFLSQLFFLITFSFAVVVFVPLFTLCACDAFQHIDDCIFCKFSFLFHFK